MANEVFEQLKSQISIVDVISRYVKLQKKGNNYIGLCPFHDDKKPSMSVSESKKFFKCFSCGKGGDVFAFVSEKENISYKEAVIKVCNQNHVDLPDSFKLTTTTKENPYQYQYDIISKLNQFYMYSLNTLEGKEAKNYLYERGLDDNLIKYFKIGYAPKDSLLSISYLREKENYSIEQLDSLKILSSSTNQFKDRYSNRIIFPISNIYSKIVGFSGRKYAKDDISDAKYINSVDSQIFKKGDLLYNFDNAKQYIEQTKQVYVLEGFMDVIACYKAGIKNIVGLMGTSISSSHIKLFKQLNVEVRLLLDADEAGQIGISKAINQLCLNNIRCVVVRPYSICKDSDELFKLKGSKGVNDALNDLISPVSYLIDRGLKAHKLITLSDKEDFIINRIKIIYKVSSDIEKTAMINELASRLNLDVLSIGKLLNSNDNTYIKSIERIKENNVVPNYKKSNYRENKITRPDHIIEGTSKRIDIQLREYAKKYFIKEQLMSLIGISDLMLLDKIITNESKYLARICKSYNDYSNFKKIDFNFYIPSFRTVYQLVDQYYEGLTNKVYLLMEKDYSKIIQDYTSYCQTIDIDTSKNNINDDFYEVINILNIFKTGKEVSVSKKDIQDDEFSKDVKKYVNYINKNIQFDIEFSKIN